MFRYLRRWQMLVLLTFGSLAPCCIAYLHAPTIRKRLRKQSTVLFGREGVRQDEKRVLELLQLADVHPSTIESISSGGFCNSLYRVQGHGQKVVVKLFSPLGKARMHPTKQYHVDNLASRNGLGPKLLCSNVHGIVMEQIEGNVCDETMVHCTSEWISKVAPLLASFHTLEIPSPPHMLWHSIDAMMHLMSSNAKILIEEEILRQRQSLDTLNLPVVLGHGDLKPSNIIGTAEPRFIDFELSGLHYRGFDVAKLFRTDQLTTKSQSILDAFVNAYVESVPSLGREHMQEVRSLMKEAQLMEPLTWLEAAAFFTCSACIDPLNAEKWNRLAMLRMESYKRSMTSFDHNVREFINVGEDD